MVMQVGNAAVLMYVNPAGSRLAVKDETIPPESCFKTPNRDAAEPMDKVVLS
jgi:hypothetical protein